MPGRPYSYNRQYSVLDTADNNSLAVQSDSQGYHEYKIYNETKDRMWAIVSEIMLCGSIREIMIFAAQLRVLLMRADSMWVGIRESVKAKAIKIKLEDSRTFEYKHEMKEKADLVKRYMDFQNNPYKFESYGQLDPEFREFTENVQEQVEFFKNKFSDIIQDTDTIWNGFAAKLGLGLPLKIREDEDLFFRSG